MDRGTAVSTCEHGHKPEQCQLCAAWESAIYNQHRAERAEEEIARWRAEALAARRLLTCTNLDWEDTDYAAARKANGEE